MKHLKTYKENNSLRYKTQQELLDYLKSLNNTFIFIDTETTGLGGPKKKQLTQVSAISIDNLIGEYEELDNFDEKILLTDETKRKIEEEEITKPEYSTKRILKFNRYGKGEDFSIEGENYLNEKDALNNFFDWVDTFENPLFIIQNAQFDMNMLAGRSGRKLEYLVIDTKYIIQMFIIPIFEKLSETNDKYKKILNDIGTSIRDNGLINSSMGKWGPVFNVDITGYHDALNDCRITIDFFRKLIDFIDKHKDVDIKHYQYIRHTSGITRQSIETSLND